MERDVADSRRVLRLDSGRFPNLSRRGFLRGVLAGATLAIAGTATRLPGRVIATPEYAVPSGAPSQTGTLDVGRLNVATENFAKFRVPERDQTHEMYNNTWADPTGPHEAMIAALWAPDRLEAMASWNWPPWDKTYTHAYHSIGHGVCVDGATTDNRFPFPVSRYNSMKFDIPNVYAAGDGKWCIAFDLFVFKEGTGPPWRAENVQAELFIVLKRLAYDVPPEDGTLSSYGITYGHGRWSSSSNVHAFWRKDDPAVPFRQQIDIYDFIRFLKTKGFAQDANMLPWVAFGSEPIQGSGTWRIDSFYVTLN